MLNLKCYTRRIYFYSLLHTCIIGCIHTVSGEIQLILDNTTNELTVNEDVGDVIITVSLSKDLPQQFVANYRIISGTASKNSVHTVSNFAGNYIHM